MADVTGARSIPAVVAEVANGYLRGVQDGGALSVPSGGTTVTIYYRPTVTGAITSTQGVLPAGAFFVMSDPPSSIT